MSYTRRHDSAGADPEGGAYHAVHDPDATADVSTTILLALSESTGLPPDELDPLFGTIDPDALDALFAEQLQGTDEADISFRFTHAGHVVSVFGDGRITIEKG